MSLNAAERFARYVHQPAAWASQDDLNDWHAEHVKRYQTTQDWTERNKSAWGTWFRSCSPAQRRRIRKKMHRSLAGGSARSASA